MRIRLQHTMFVGPRVAVAINCCHGHREAQNAKRPNDHRAETLHGGRACARPPAESARLPWKHETGGHGRLTPLNDAGRHQRLRCNDNRADEQRAGGKGRAARSESQIHVTARSAPHDGSRMRTSTLPAHTQANEGVPQTPTTPVPNTHTLSIGTAIAECSALAASANLPLDRSHRLRAAHSP